MSFSFDWEKYSLENVKSKLSKLTFFDPEMKKLINEKPYFLDHEKLSAVGRLSVNGEYVIVDKILLISKPSPAVLDQLRKNASRKARDAKKSGDWEKVIEYLEGYIKYANRWKSFCIQFVNQEPPTHTNQDQDLLQLAREKTNK
jgi:hypothetical protein